MISGKNSKKVDDFHVLYSFVTFLYNEIFDNKWKTVLLNTLFSTVVFTSAKNNKIQKNSIFRYKNMLNTFFVKKTA